MKNIRLEILTEEPSMENFLRVILPKILPSEYKLELNCFIRTHEGKSHLKKSIPKKFKAYPRFGLPVKVMIIQDQDSSNCIILKEELIKLTNGSEIPFIVRIACKELENWYLGDMKAIEKVYPRSKASRLQHKAKYKNPDDLNGSEEMTLIAKDFTKSFASREIPKYMDIERNNSKSFNQLIIGLKKLLD